MTYIVRVGADRETARPEFAEFSGVDYFGPFFDDEQATAFAQEVREEFTRLAEEDPQGFVYGAVEVTLIPLRHVHSFHAHAAAARAARNWHLDKDGREASR